MLLSECSELEFGIMVLLERPEIDRGSEIWMSEQGGNCVGGGSLSEVELGLQIIVIQCEKSKNIQFLLCAILQGRGNN